MANESKRVLGSWTSLESNGGSISSAAFAQANDATLDVSTPLPLFVDLFLQCAFTTAPTAGETINAYARALDIAGGTSEDGQVPSANFLAHYLGSFLVENLGSSTTQYLALPQCTLPAEKCDIYLQNSTGQSLNAGWVLKYRTHTIGPA